MKGPSLYEVLFEGKKIHICENCLHEGICEYISDILPIDNSGQCEMWEDKENGYPMRNEN